MNPNRGRNIPTGTEQVELRATPDVRFGSEDSHGARRSKNRTLIGNLEPFLVPAGGRVSPCCNENSLRHFPFRVLPVEHPSRGDHVFIRGDSLTLPYWRHRTKHSDCMVFVRSNAVAVDDVYCGMEDARCFASTTSCISISLFS